MKTETKETLKKLSPLLLIVLVTILLSWGFGSGTFQKTISAFWPSDENKNPPTTINKEVDLQNILPKDMHGVWLKSGVDFPDSDSPEEEIKAEINSIFSSLPSLYIDTIFVSAADSPLCKETESSFDPLNYIFQLAKEQNIYCILSLPADVLFSDIEKLESDNEKLLDILQEYNTSAIILDGLDSLSFEETENEGENENSVILANKIRELSSLIKTISPSTLTGFSAVALDADIEDEAPSKTENAENSDLFDDFHAPAKEWVINELFDFIYLHPSLEMKDENPSLHELINWWEQLIKKTNTYAILGIETDSKEKKEFSEQLSLISPLQSFCGSAFDSYKDFLENSEAKNDYLAYMNSANLDKLKTGSLDISRPAAKRTITNESTVSFMGTADPAYPLYCNGVEIPRSSLGLFSISLQLRAGENEFSFSHNGISHTYTVIYELNLLLEVSPSGKTEAGGGTLINVFALAYKEAEVHALVGKTKIKMLPSEQNAFGQSAAPSDFASFSGSFALPITSKRIDFGNISFFASFNGITAEMQGGEISSLPELNMSNIGDSNIIQAPTNYTSLYSEKSLPLKTAYQNHGLGTALMCEILKDYAETTPAEAANQKSHPLYRPLLKGSFDYVTSIANYDDKMHYILASGRKVFATDVKIIPEGNKLPLNSLDVRSSRTRGDTEIIIKTDWIVPISSLISPQEYFVGHQSRPFNVSSFTGQYLDITFHYTTAASGRINVWGSNVIESARWINVGVNESSTLRIQLKNSGRFYGYAVNINDNGEFQITIKNRDTNMRKKLIILDPGHGGRDPGAIGVYSNIYESHLNLLIAQKTKAELEKMGATVLLTRDIDISPSLEERILMIRRHKPDLYISIHHDASTSDVNSGTHTFYYSSYSMPLARAIHNNIVNAYVQNQIIPPNTAEYSKIDLGIKFYPFAVTRVEECPSVLVECGYLTNAVNANGLLNESNQNAIAAAIANGARDYFQNN